jgi:DNA-binding NtrC family response regulator
MPKRILFVDDEPAMLSSLRCMFRKQRHQWDMVFASSGREALAEMSKAPFDVLISDMRMPEMDGAELLAEVQARWPQVTCFILSGYAEAEARARATAVARAYFSKPCDIEMISAAIHGV